MARPWQYPFELHTRAAIIERYGCVPEWVEIDERAPEGCAWPDLGGTLLPAGYEALLDHILVRVGVDSPDCHFPDQREAHLEVWKRKAPNAANFVK